MTKKTNKQLNYEIETSKIYSELKDKEIKTQIGRVNKAKAVRNWCILIFIVVEILRFIF